MGVKVEKRDENQTKKEEGSEELVEKKGKEGEEAGGEKVQVKPEFEDPSYDAEEAE